MNKNELKQQVFPRVEKVWHRLFLEERPSIGLSFFRMAVALTTGLHVIPSFFHLEDTFFITAFKTCNYSFFPVAVVDLIQKSPDWLVLYFVMVFCLSCFFLLIGFFSQASCIVMTFTCYYFYALNAFAFGTLSWDILLVTLFLMCLMPYHGDYFSVDCLMQEDIESYKTKRPFFLQRLLQIQVASTFFYTALYKITAQGDWLTGNPLYHLMNYPPAGVTKLFLLKDFLANQPQICYLIGVFIVITELSMPYLLFNPKTRRSGIYLGFIFHIALLLTLDVPAIFFFLFPPQLLLFIHPDHLIRAIDQIRARNAQLPRSRVVFDGNCEFCRSCIKQLLIMDLFNKIQVVDYHMSKDLKELHPDLTKEKCHSEMYLVEPEGTLYGGFFAFRRLSLKLPTLYPLSAILYFPGISIFGPRAYRFISKNRYFFHGNPVCQDNACVK